MAEQWFRHKWLDAIYASELDPIARHVAEIFAGKARQDSIAWEPLSNLVMKTGRTKKTCIKARQTLVDGGWLTEIKASTHKAASHFLLVIPGTEGCSQYTPTADEGVEPVHPRGVATTPQRGTEYTPRGVATTPSQSVVNPDQSISLSPEQLLVKELLGLDEGDERLMKVPQLLADKSPDTPKPWLRGCHRNGDLLDLLEKAGTTSSAWGTDTDEQTMPNPHYIEGTNAAEVNIEDWHRARMRTLGLKRDEMDDFYAEARRNIPHGKPRVLWREALTNAEHDVKENPRCDECGSRLDQGHYGSCSQRERITCESCNSEASMTYHLGLRPCSACNHKRQILKETA